MRVIEYGMEVEIPPLNFEQRQNLVIAVAIFHNSRWISYHDGVRRDVLRNDTVGADDCTVSDGDATPQFCKRADVNIVTNNDILIV